MKRIYFILAALTAASYGAEQAAFVSVPSTFGTASSDAPADVVNWWKKFNDPELNALIDRALKSNLNLLTAEAHIKQARAAVGQAKALGLPTLSQGDALNHNIGPAPTSSNPLLQKQLGTGHSVATNRVADLGLNESRQLGVDRNTTKAAKSDLIVAEEDRRNVMVTLMGDVATDYVQLRGLQEQVAIASQAAQVRQDYLGLVTSKLTGGLTTDAEVTPLELDLENIEAPIPDMQASIDLLAHRLAVLTGDEPSALLDELSTPKPVPTGPAEVATGLPVDLLRRRPDVRKAEQQIESAKDRTKAARAERLPKFSLTGTFGARDQELSSVKIGNTGRFFAIGPSLSIPLFSGGKIRADIASQTAQQQAAVLNYQQTVLQAFQEVEDALAKYRHANERREVVEGMIGTSQRKLTLARQMYEAGIQDYFPVVDAQESLIAAQNQLADNREDVAEDLISLYRSLGGGWD